MSTLQRMKERRTQLKGAQKEQVGKKGMHGPYWPVVHDKSELISELWAQFTFEKHFKNNIVIVSRSVALIFVCKLGFEKKKNVQLHRILQPAYAPGLHTLFGYLVSDGLQAHRWGVAFYRHLAALGDRSALRLWLQSAPLDVVFSSTSGALMRHSAHFQVGRY